jgi:putative addiction module component (TIGR02574 family)
MAMEISIEDSIPDLTDEQKREIDRRISAYEANPEDVLTWDEVKASIVLRSVEKPARNSQRPDPPKSPLERGTLKSIPVPPFQGG